MIPLGVLASSYVAPAGGIIEFLYSGGITPKDTSWTFPSVPLGTAAADRYIVVHVSTRDNLTGAVTIGTTSATELIEVNGGGNYGSLYMASVPSGTSADITVTNNSSNRLLIGVWGISGYATLSNVATASSASNGSTASLTNIEPGDIIIAGSQMLSPGAAKCSWDGVTEQAEYGPYLQMFAADGYAVATGASHDITATWTEAWYGMPTVAVALRPS